MEFWLANTSVTSSGVASDTAVSVAASEAVSAAVSAVVSVSWLVSPVDVWVSDPAHPDDSMETVSAQIQSFAINVFFFMGASLLCVRQIAAVGFCFKRVG